jgi:hypothetical protein
MYFRYLSGNENLIPWWIVWKKKRTPLSRRLINYHSCCHVACSSDFSVALGAAEPLPPALIDACDGAIVDSGGIEPEGVAGAVAEAPSDSIPS